MVLCSAGNRKIPSASNNNPRQQGSRTATRWALRHVHEGDGSKGNTIGMDEGLITSIAALNIETAFVEANGGAIGHTMRNVPWRKWRDRRKAEKVATDDLVAATDRLNLDVTLDPQRSYPGVGAASEASQGASASVTTLVQPVGTEQTGVTALQPDDIRVLDIDPARLDDDNMIQCRRRVLHLPRDTIPDDVPAPWLVQPLLRESYITLSYAWGETKEDGSHLTETIRCDGALLRITSNLHMAFLRIRNMMHVERRISVEPVWIDTLCIEQDDIEERNVQVQNMGHVYQSSSQVIVWLGETDNETNPGFWFACFRPQA
ncbi:hypothetical protein LTR17_015418 [Elasticomyces elasticus]|nr:hypothetical protein LTR17_015418 [Elasticomyces elasticus]